MKQADSMLTRALFLRVIYLMNHIFLISSLWRGQPSCNSGFSNMVALFAPKEMQCMHRSVLTSEEG